MNPFSSGTRLRDMIRAIRACKTAAEERAVVRKECAAIRGSVSENDQDYRHRNLAKLMFIHMLGYPTHFGQMECLKLIASAGFPEKRIGYLGLMLLLDERQEVLMLVTNSLKQDLNHPNQYVVGLALCALGNICSAEMARDLSPEIERLLQLRDPNIRKKAALCSIRIIRKAPDLSENFINHAAALLKEKNHGVLITGIELCTDICKVNTEALVNFRKRYTEALVRVLKEAVNSSYAPEYDIAGVTDPFLQIRLLKLLRVLGHGDADASDCMNDILAQVVTKTESNKNAGNAILYECVETIMNIEDSGGLKVLAINILGRFLANRDNNIRYVALNMLMKAVKVDSQAMQRHRGTILECVKDADASIRKRALELVYLLVNENNVQSLTKELIEYLEISDSDFKSDLTAKICSIIEKFSPDKKWYIDQMLKVLCQAGKCVKDEVWHGLVVVISNANGLHGYAVRCLYRVFQNFRDQECLAQVTVWCIGEYGEMLVNNVRMLDKEEPLTVTESDVVNIMESVLKHHDADLNIKMMSLVALLKLSDRFPSCSMRIRNMIIEYKGNFVLELQQRSIEFNSIIEKHQNIRAMLLERMPVLDEATYSGRRAGSMTSAFSSTVSNGSLNLPNGVSKPSAAPLADLLDLNSDDSPVISSSGGDFLQDLLGIGGTPVISQSDPGSAQNSKSGADVLLDLLSVGNPPPVVGGLPTTTQSSQNNETGLEKLSSLSLDSAQRPLPEASASMMNLLDGFQPNSGDNTPAYTSIIAHESTSLKITFSMSKPSGDKKTTLIDASFINLSSTVYTDFVFKAAVPKFLQLHLDPATSTTLPASGSESVTQKIKVTNNMHGKKQLAMRIRVNYLVNGKEKLEEGQITSFPRQL